MGNKHSKLRIPNSVKNVRENGLKKHTQSRHTTFLTLESLLFELTSPQIRDESLATDSWRRFSLLKPSRERKKKVFLIVYCHRGSPKPSLDESKIKFQHHKAPTIILMT